MKRSPRLIVEMTLLSEDAVKTKSFENPVYLGDPLNMTRLLSRFEVDELIILDISSRYGESSVSARMLSGILESAFMPIAFGGGINDLDSAKEKFQLGFDKVVLKSGLMEVRLVENISGIYGQQSTIGCLDIVKQEKNWQVNCREYTEAELIDYVKVLQERGIGEILVHDIKNEGTRRGFGLEEICLKIADVTDIPVSVSGGIPSIDAAADLIKNSKIDSVGGTTMFVFDPKTNSVFLSYPRHEEWNQVLAAKP